VHANDSGEHRHAFVHLLESRVRLAERIGLHLVQSQLGAGILDAEDSAMGREEIAGRGAGGLARRDGHGHGAAICRGDEPGHTRGLRRSDLERGFGGRLSIGGVRARQADDDEHR
jgi:hypothetical protein